MTNSAIVTVFNVGVIAGCVGANGATVVVGTLLVNIGCANGTTTSHAITRSVVAISTRLVLGVVKDSIDTSAIVAGSQVGYSTPFRVFEYVASRTT